MNKVSLVCNLHIPFSLLDAQFACFLLGTPYSWILHLGAHNSHAPVDNFLRADKAHFDIIVELEKVYLLDIYIIYLHHSLKCNQKTYFFPYIMLRFSRITYTYDFFWRITISLLTSWVLNWQPANSNILPSRKILCTWGVKNGLENQNFEKWILGTCGLYSSVQGSIYN